MRQSEIYFNQLYFVIPRQSYAPPRKFRLVRIFIGQRFLPYKIHILKNIHITQAKTLVAFFIHLSVPLVAFYRGKVNALGILDLCGKNKEVRKKPGNGKAKRYYTDDGVALKHHKQA